MSSPSDLPTRFRFFTRDRDLESPDIPFEVDFEDTSACEQIRQTRSPENKVKAIRRRYISGTRMALTHCSGVSNSAKSNTFTNTYADPVVVVMGVVVEGLVVVMVNAAVVLGAVPSRAATVEFSVEFAMVPNHAVGKAAVLIRKQTHYGSMRWRTSALAIDLRNTV